MGNSAEQSGLVLGISALGVLLLAMAIFVNVGTYNLAAAAILLVLITVCSAYAFRRMADADGDPTLLLILLGALFAKLVFSLARYWMVNSLYGGGGDSNRYDADGWDFAELVRGGTLFPPVEEVSGGESGTGTIVRLTGYFYAVVGRSIFAGFFFYSWLAFWGCVLCWRGFRHAFPEGDSRRYMLLVLFWPSLLFWPSSIGKDAVMVFLLGVATYGASRLLAPKPWAWGVIPFGIGVAGMMLIRSHVALMAVLAVAVATAFALLGGTKADNARGRGRAVRFGGLVVMAVLAMAAMTQTTRFFSEEAGQATSTTEALELTVERTQQGGSQFQPIVVTNPVQVPAATVSVLFRPFPWEARNVGSLISAGEAAMIGVLFIVSWKRLRRWPGSAWRRPILIYGLLYSLMFVVAFSSIGNAGILARQRSQMLPVLFFAFAVPVTKWWRSEREPVDELASVAESESV